MLRTVFSFHEQSPKDVRALKACQNHTAAALFLHVQSCPVLCCTVKVKLLLSMLWSLNPEKWLRSPVPDRVVSVIRRLRDSIYVHPTLEGKYWLSVDPLVKSELFGLELSFYKVFKFRTYSRIQRVGKIGTIHTYFLDNTCYRLEFVCFSFLTKDQKGKTINEGKIPKGNSGES